MDVGNTPERILEYILGEFGLEINDRKIEYVQNKKDHIY